MDNLVSLLVTVLDESEGTLLRFAIKLDPDSISNFWEHCEFPLEKAARDAVHSVLPDHVKKCGPVVEWEQIFDVYV